MIWRFCWGMGLMDVKVIIGHLSLRSTFRNMISLTVVLFDCESESDQCFLKFRAVSFIFVTQLSYLTMDSPPGKHQILNWQYLAGKWKSEVPYVSQRDFLHRWQHQWAFAPPWSLPPKACQGWNRFNFGFAIAFFQELDSKKLERALQGQKRKPESGSASKKPREDFFSPQVHQVDK